MTTLGVIGVGHLAGFMLTGLRRGGFGGDLLLGPRNAERAARLAAECGGRVAGSSQEVVDGADVILLATRPTQAAEAVSGLAFRPDQLVLSACAGVGRHVLAPLVEPAHLVRIMPITAARIGCSPTLICPDDDRARALLAPTGEPIALADDAGFDAAGVNAAVYGWFFALAAEVEEATVAAGVDRPTARAVVLRTMAATAAVGQAEPGTPLIDLMRELSTEGGFTAQGHAHLVEADAYRPWRDAFDALIDRLRKA